MINELKNNIEKGWKLMVSCKFRHPNKRADDGRQIRKFLREDEVRKLIKAAGNVGRCRHRDATLILIMFRHGLRISEAINLIWEQIDLKAKRLFVRRLKNGKPSIHELNSHEVEALQELRQEGSDQFSYVFTSTHGGALDRSTAGKMIRRAGKRAKLGVTVNTHKLRHSCGYHLINVRKIDPRRIQDYLGHKDIRHTVAYTELDENKFDGIWGD